MLLALAYPRVVLAQQLILKVKPAYRAACTDSTLAFPSLNNALTQLGAYRIQRTYPTAKAPLVQELGTAPPDLSLTYTLTYSSVKNLIPVAQLAPQLAQDAHLAYAEPAPTFRPFYTPSDPQLNAQWYLSNIQAQAGWELERGDSNVVIAIVDDAIQWNHPDLLANLAINRADPIDGLDNDHDGYLDNFRGWDFIGANELNPLPDNDPSPSAAVRHGTWVAGYAAAVPDNTIGVAGVGFNCRFLPIKTAADGPGTTGNIVAGLQGIHYAADHGAAIINCSWGSTTPSQALQDVVDYATNRGALVVAATGNSADETLYFPAQCRGVLAVACTDTKDVKASNSTYGPTISLCAPGGGASTAYPNSYSGATAGLYTSFASPIVAGVAALVKAQHPAYTGRQVGEQLRRSADNIDGLNPGFAGLLGNGRVNLLKALTFISPAVRMDAYSLTNSVGSPPKPGQAANLSVVLRNYLAPTQPLTITLTTNDAQVAIVQGKTTVAALSTLATASTAATPFRLLLASSLPANYTVLFQLTFSDGTYTDYQNFSILLNPTYVDLEANLVATSLSQTGNFGFADFPADKEGQGFRYQGSDNLLAEGGLLVGVAGASLVNNIRQASITEDADFTSTVPISLAQQGKGLSTSTAVFTDAGAPAPLNLSIVQHSYQYSYPPNDKFVLLAYTLTNASTTSLLSNLQAGLFADWDLGADPNKNSSSWDAARKLAYATSNTTASPYTGLLALTHKGQAHSYSTSVTAFPFTRGAKLHALLTDSNSIAGQDIFQIAAQGPFLLLPGDSTTTAWALLAENSLTGLLTAANAAENAYNCLVTNQNLIVKLGKDTTSCQPFTLNGTTVGAVSYAWSTGASTPSLQVTQSGNYSLVATSAAGCTGFDVVAVRLSPNYMPLSQVVDTLAFTQQAILFRDSTLLANYHRWDFGDGYGYLGPNTQHVYKAPGFYQISLVVGDSTCNTTQHFRVHVVKQPSPSDSTPAHIVDSTVVIYPNPARGSIYLAKSAFTASSPLDVWLYDSHGGLVSQWHTNPRDWPMDLMLPLPPTAGFYIVRTQQNGHLYSKKIIVP